MRMGRRIVALLVGGAGNCCRKPKWLGSCNRVKTEYDLAKTQNSWVNNEKEEFVYACKNEINTSNVCLCALFVGVPYCLEEKAKKMPLRILPKY